MSSEAMMAPLRLVDMCTVLDATVEAAVTGLHDLAATLPRQSDAERYNIPTFLKYPHNACVPSHSPTIISVKSQETSPPPFPLLQFDRSRNNSGNPQEACATTAPPHHKAAPAAATCSNGMGLGEGERHLAGQQSSGGVAAAHGRSQRRCGPDGVFTWRAQHPAGAREPWLL